jgi:hypothetical protein
MMEFERRTLSEKSAELFAGARRLNSSQCFFPAVTLEVRLSSRGWEIVLAPSRYLAQTRSNLLACAQTTQSDQA